MPRRIVTSYDKMMARRASSDVTLEFDSASAKVVGMAVTPACKDDSACVSSKSRECPNAALRRAA